MQQRDTAWEAFIVIYHCPPSPLFHFFLSLHFTNRFFLDLSSFNFISSFDAYFIRWHSSLSLKKSTCDLFFYPLPPPNPLPLLSFLLAGYVAVVFGACRTWPTARHRSLQEILQANPPTMLGNSKHYSLQHKLLLQKTEAGVVRVWGRKTERGGLQTCITSLRGGLDHACLWGNWMLEYAHTRAACGQTGWTYSQENVYMHIRRAAEKTHYPLYLQRCTIWTAPIEDDTVKSNSRRSERSVTLADRALI